MDSSKSEAGSPHSPWSCLWCQNKVVASWMTSFGLTAIAGNKWVWLLCTNLVLSEDVGQFTARVAVVEQVGRNGVRVLAR